MKTLYSNYQDFILFDEEFRLILWSEVDLQLAINEVEYLFNIYFYYFYFLDRDILDYILFITTRATRLGGIT